MDETQNRTPKQLPQKSRESHTDLFLAKALDLGFSVPAVQNSLMLLHAPGNLRFLGAVTSNFLRLLKKFPSLTNTLPIEVENKLDDMDVLLNVIDSLEFDDMHYEITASPADYPRGNLFYSAHNHPLYSLLLLTLPYEDHEEHFDGLIAATTVSWLTLLPPLEWKNYKTFLSLKSDASNSESSHFDEHIPFVLIRRIYNIESNLRKLADAELDPFGFISDEIRPSDIESLLDSMIESRFHATYIESVRTAGVKIKTLRTNSFYDSVDYSSQGGTGLLTEGRHLGTLISGPYHFNSIDEDESADIVHCIPVHILRKAANEDIDPLELIEDDSITLIDLGAANSLPDSARKFAASRNFQQIAKAQQLLPFRKDGLKSEKIEAINRALQKATSTLEREDQLILIAVIATGRLPNRLEIDITLDTAADDRVANLELDIASKTWRLMVNAPNLKNHPTPAGSVPVTQTAIIPDLFGACDIAMRCLAIEEGFDSGKLRVPFTVSPDRIAKVNEFIHKELNEFSVSPTYLAKLISMATFELTGDLATGALISSWLPCNASTYLHYLSVDRLIIAERYLSAVKYLSSHYGLEYTESDSTVTPGHVGTSNCPSDSAAHTLVDTLKTMLNSLPVNTRDERLHYSNVYTCYSVCFLAAGLGYRARRDPRPNIEPLSENLLGGAFATFWDKATSSSHYRTIYCPHDLKTHLQFYDTFRQSIPYLIEPVGNADRYFSKMDSLLFIWFDANGNPQELRPIHVEQLVQEFFPFKINCHRRRARSRMFEYTGDKSVIMGRGYSVWMGHWPQFNSPHRSESGFSIEILRLISEHIIEPMLITDGWVALEHRL